MPPSELFTVCGYANRVPGNIKMNVTGGDSERKKMVCGRGGKEFFFFFFSYRKTPDRYGCRIRTVTLKYFGKRTETASLRVSSSNLPPVTAVCRDGVLACSTITERTRTRAAHVGGWGGGTPNSVKQRFPPTFIELCGPPNFGKTNFRPLT